MALAGFGLGRGSRIAVALPDGPDAGLAMLAAMSWATCAPLNPDLDVEACASSFAQLSIDAVIAAEGDDRPIVAAARAAHLLVLRLAARTGDVADLFTLRAESAQTPVQRAPPEGDDVALVMRTSGTTGGPKVVPIAHRALLGSGSTSSIGTDDRCICVSPLHTASGLWFGLVVPLTAGASTVVASGFDAPRFFEWLHAFRPTYFSASPTVHAAIMDELLHNGQTLPTSLRFVRSSSNAMSASQQAKFESVLRIPIVQGYGATEAGLISQDSPLPGQRRKGSVGIPHQTQVMIVGTGGEGLPAGATGEILVSGPGVMRGYENDPEANDRAFHAGWFRTGDVGYFDADGYLFITGRLNEIINRGGLKVAPAEVDAVFARHPAVQDAATVGMPHPSLGHDVVTAVILRHDVSVTAQQLRDYALQNLMPFKVPTSVVIVDDFPRNALGKVQRSGLADIVKERMRTEFVPPRDAEEVLVAGVFAAVLDLPRAGALDNFFDLGGDSLLGMQVLARVSGGTGVTMEPRVLFEAPTVAQFAQRLRDAKDGPRKLRSGGRGLVPRMLALVFSAALALSIVVAPYASAQDWPNRSVRLVVGQTPGAPVDLIARIVAEQLSELWQQPVVVENRGGAGGTIAAEQVAKAPADGYTLLLGGQSNLAAVASAEVPRNYDPLADFAPIGRVVHVPYFLVVNVAVPARTALEFVAEARAHPGRLSFVSFGEATFSSIAYRQLMTATKIDLLEIPYKGASQAMADLVAGRVDTSLAPLATVKQHAATGSLRIIAATGAKRASAAPEIATLAEQGVAGVVVETWYGLAAPAGVSVDVRARLVDALARIRRSPAMVKKLEQLDYEPMFDDPAQFAAVIRADIETFTRAMKRAPPATGQ